MGEKLTRRIHSFLSLLFQVQRNCWRKKRRNPPNLSYHIIYGVRLLFRFLWEPNVPFSLQDFQITSDFINKYKNFSCDLMHNLGNCIKKNIRALDTIGALDLAQFEKSKNRKISKLPYTLNWETFMLVTSPAFFLLSEEKVKKKKWRKEKKFLFLLILFPKFLLFAIPKVLRCKKTNSGKWDSFLQSFLIIKPCANFSQNKNWLNASLLDYLFIHFGILLKIIKNVQWFILQRRSQNLFSNFSIKSPPTVTRNMFC